MTQIFTFNLEQNKFIFGSRLHISINNQYVLQLHALRLHISSQRSDTRAIHVMVQLKAQFCCIHAIQWRNETRSFCENFRVCVDDHVVTLKWNFDSVI